MNWFLNIVKVTHFSDFEALQGPAQLMTVILYLFWFFCLMELIARSKQATQSISCFCLNQLLIVLIFYWRYQLIFYRKFANCLKAQFATGWDGFCFQPHHTGGSCSCGHCFYFTVDYCLSSCGWCSFREGTTESTSTLSLNFYVIQYFAFFYPYQKRVDEVNQSFLLYSHVPCFAYSCTYCPKAILR